MLKKCACNIREEIKKYGRPMHMNERPKFPLHASVGSKKICRTWDAEAALRMLHNNLDPAVALKPEELIVYGGSGRAARNWHEFNKITRALKNLGENETLCIQSGKPVYIAPSHKEAPRVIIANSNLVPKWATPDRFSQYDRLGLMMYGQMTAGSWIYIGTQGILQGTYETFAACAKKDFHSNSLAGKFVLSAGMGAMSGAQPLAVTMNEGVILNVEARRARIEQKVREGYCDILSGNLDEALKLVDEALKNKQPRSIGLVGNAAEIYPKLIQLGITPDIVTDQTPAHDILSYMPIGDIAELDALRIRSPKDYERRAHESIVKHVEAMLKMQKRGAIVFDYGNNLRAQAEIGGLKIRDSNGQFLYPGFVVKYIRPLFCEGKGPFRWAILSGKKEDQLMIDKLALEVFPKNAALKRWIKMAQKKVPITGLPTRICWLGYGERAKFGLAINDYIAKEKISAPIVIGRDHLDTGSVASPYRETENMKDGSDSIADWPLLNFALNTANGASWVSFHHGGGVGIGNSLHSGMVIVADGTKKRASRIERVLTVDPGIGVARHADSGENIAKKTAFKKGIKIPEITC